MFLCSSANLEWGKQFNMRVLVIRDVGGIAMTGEAEERSVIHEVLHTAIV